MQRSESERSAAKKCYYAVEKQRQEEWNGLNPCKFTIEDYVDNPAVVQQKEEALPLPFGLGYELDTVEKARQWLTHPSNWFKSGLFILKWDGLVPRIAETHGKRLIAEPYDDGLPSVVVFEQRRRRTKKDRGESIEEIPESNTDESTVV